MLYDLLLTFYFLALVFISFLVSLPILIILYPLLSQKNFARLNEILGSVVLYGMSYPGFWNITINDTRKNKTFTGRYVMIANHGSYIDTPLIWQLPTKKKFMMAEIFMRIPLFGHICKLCGHIPVNKFRRTSTQVAVIRSIKTMEDGSSFVIFPEGRRSSDPSLLLPFKTGAFRIAQHTEVPILPIAICGSGKALPVGGICHPANIDIFIGDPIWVDKKYENIKEAPAIQECRDFISKYMNSQSHKFLDDHSSLSKKE